MDWDWDCEEDGGRVVEGGKGVPFDLLLVSVENVFPNKVLDGLDEDDEEEEEEEEGWDEGWEESLFSLFEQSTSRIPSFPAPVLVLFPWWETEW